MKVAVVLFNLGGPDKLESVEPFLFNLFNGMEQKMLFYRLKGKNVFCLTLYTH